MEKNWKFTTFEDGQPVASYNLANRDAAKAIDWIARGGNIEDLRYMEAHNRNSMVKFLAIPGKDHFSVLAPANELIASKILGDSGAIPGLVITDADASTLGGR